MNKLGLLILCLSLSGTAVYAESARELVHEMNLDHQAWLRGKIQKLPKKATVEVALRNGKTVRGTFQNFVKYDDGVWILPMGKRGFFADEAYDIGELLDIKVIVLRPI